jgi:fido (protein-threonine AMPylation protein)
MVPSPQWFIYGFVRQEAVVSSEIEGTQATLQDVVTYEATKQAERPDDVREVCNYVDALTYARAEIAKPKGLPLSSRLLCEAHKRLMRGVRGADRQPGEIRRSQNWIGGTRPGNASFVPPPPEKVPALMAQLDKWLHSSDALPPLVKAGLAHVQFETIHPFLDGNGRIGRLLVTLLLEHWGLLKTPMLYLSLAFSDQARHGDRARGSPARSPAIEPSRHTAPGRRVARCQQANSDQSDRVAREDRHPEGDRRQAPRPRIRLPEVPRCAHWGLMQRARAVIRMLKNSPRGTLFGTLGNEASRPRFVEQHGDYRCFVAEAIAEVL